MKTLKQVAQLVEDLREAGTHQAFRSPLTKALYLLHLSNALVSLDKAIVHEPVRDTQSRKDLLAEEQVLLKDNGCEPRPGGGR